MARESGRTRRPLVNVSRAQEGTMGVNVVPVVVASSTRVYMGEDAYTNGF
jgi:hypothetical protein